MDPNEKYILLGGKHDENHPLHPHLQPHQLLLWRQPQRKTVAWDPSAALPS